MSGSTSVKKWPRQGLLAEVANLGVTSTGTKCPYIAICIDESVFQGLVDSGPVRSLVSRTLFQKLKTQHKVLYVEATSIQCVGSVLMFII